MQKAVVRAAIAAVTALAVGAPAAQASIKTTVKFKTIKVIEDGDAVGCGEINSYADLGTGKHQLVPKAPLSDSGWQSTLCGGGALYEYPQNMAEIPPILNLEPGTVNRVERTVPLAGWSLNLTLSAVDADYGQHDHVSGVWALKAPPAGVTKNITMQMAGNGLNLVYSATISSVTV